MSVPNPQPVHVDGCIEPPLRRTMQQLAQNDLYLIQLGDTINSLVADVKELKGPGPKRLNGRPAQIYLDNSQSYETVPPKLRPATVAKTTTDMPTYSATFSDRTCKAKMYASNGAGTWDVTGDEVDVYDFSGNFWYVRSGEVIYADWDRQEEKWIVIGTTAPDHREGRLDGALTRDGSTNAERLVYGGTYSAVKDEVFGYMVPDGKQIPDNARVKYNACQIRKEWVVYSSDTCVEDAP